MFGNKALRNRILLLLENNPLSAREIKSELKLWFTPYTLLWSMRNEGLIKYCSIPDLTGKREGYRQLYYYKT